MQSISSILRARSLPMHTTAALWLVLALACAVAFPAAACAAPQTIQVAAADLNAQHAVPAYRAGDTLAVTGPVPLDENGWRKLRALAEPFALHLQNGQTTIPRRAMDGNAAVVSLDAPDVRAVETGAFFRCPLAAVSLPQAVSIADHAFYLCPLTDFGDDALPAALTIGDLAFYGSGLTALSLPRARAVGKSAFADCTSMRAASLPEAVQIGESAFLANTALSRLFLPKARTIGNHAFSGCPLSEIDLPEALTIGDAAFSHNSAATRVSLPKAVSVGQASFMQCRIAVLFLPSTRTVGSLAFAHNPALERIVLPSAESLDENAFLRCPKLTAAFLPRIASIGDNAFHDCPTLETLTLPDIAPQAMPQAFHETPVDRIVVRTPSAQRLGYNVLPWSRMKAFEIDAQP